MKCPEIEAYKSQGKRHKGFNKRTTSEITEIIYIITMITRKNTSTRLQLLL